MGCWDLELTRDWLLQNLQTPDELEEEDRAAQAAVRRDVVNRGDGSLHVWCCRNYRSSFDGGHQRTSQQLRS